MMASGAQFVTTLGTSMMLTGCADSLASKKLPKPFVVPIMARVPVPSGWMTWPAQEASHISTTADTVDGETMTALTAEMPVLSAFLSV